jgi:hypothetical protein
MRVMDTKTGVLWTPGRHPDGMSLRTKRLVPKKGLEPPHPCEYMDLNHARLPIPPLRHARDVQRERLDWQQVLVLQSLAVVSNLMAPDPRALDHLLEPCDSAI